VRRQAIEEPGKPLRSGKTVFLAQVTDDLEVDREEVKSYLEQFDHRVLPEQTYPQGAEAFSRAISHDLSVSDLFVQLLGPGEGRIPADLGVSYPRYQAEIAASMGKQCVRWRRPDLPLTQVRNAAYRSLLEDATVTASGLESFKSDLLGRLSEQKKNVPKPPDAMIFINADDVDFDLAKTLQARFEKHQLPSILPMRTGAASEIRSDLEENYIDCDIVLFIYGSASPGWVRGQIRLFNKVRCRREKAPQAIAILITPPLEKPALGVKYPGASEIVYSDDTSQRLIEQVFSKSMN
jgi:hypothetical protein